MNSPLALRDPENSQRAPKITAWRRTGCLEPIWAFSQERKKLHAIHFTKHRGAAIQGGFSLPILGRLLFTFISYFFECGCNFVEVDLFRDILRSEMWFLQRTSIHIIAKFPVSQKKFVCDDCLIFRFHIDFARQPPRLIVNRLPFRTRRVEQGPSLNDASR